MNLIELFSKINVKEILDNLVDRWPLLSKEEQDYVAQVLANHSLGEIIKDYAIIKLFINSNQGEK